MKIITWNVNSIRVRLERLLGVLHRHQPDVICLQETKVPDDKFPVDAIKEAGYRSTIFGQRGGYNGVALLTRDEVTDVRTGFAGNPVPEQARVVGARVGGVNVVCVYVVNGQSVDSDKYQIKLSWLAGLGDWLKDTFDPAEPLIVTGDFNIAPEDRDIYDPEAWRDQVLCTDEERRLYQCICDWGLSDLHRMRTEEAGVYTWWDYRRGAFHRDMGLRIDLVLGTAPMQERLEAVEVDREERRSSTAPTKPSDHAPVIATFKEV